MIYLKIVIELILLLIAYAVGENVGYKNGINDSDCEGICEDCEQVIYAEGWSSGVEHVLAQQAIEREVLLNHAEQTVSKPKKIAKKTSKKSKK